MKTSDDRDNRWVIISIIWCFHPFFCCRSSYFSSHRYPYSCYPMRKRTNERFSAKALYNWKVWNDEILPIPSYDLVPPIWPIQWVLDFIAFHRERTLYVANFPDSAAVWASRNYGTNLLEKTANGGAQSASGAKSEPIWRSPVCCIETTLQESLSRHVTARYNVPWQVLL